MVALNINGILALVSDQDILTFVRMTYDDKIERRKHGKKLRFERMMVRMFRAQDQAYCITQIRNESQTFGNEYLR